MNNWKKIWDKKQAKQDILSHGTPKDIFMELKRSNGFDVVENAVSYQAFYEQCQEVLQNLGGADMLGVYLKLAVEAGQTYICMSRQAY